MAEIKEPEELKGEVKNAQSENYNPFDEPVNEKVYSRPNVKMKPEEMVRDIPEPRFQPPPLEPELIKEEQPKKKEEPLNPEFNQMSNKDKKASGDHMANMIMSGYEWIWSAANQTMMFSKRKMTKLATSGEIDFNIPIPYDMQGHTMSAADFIEEYNKQQEGSLKVSPEFKERVLPVLSRVLTKRGIGMTDEQYLLSEVAMDSGQKIIAIYNATRVMKDMVNTMKEMTEAYRSGMPNMGTPPPPPPQQNSQPSTPPPPPPTEESESQDLNIDEYYEQPPSYEYEPPTSDYRDATQDVTDRVMAQVDDGVKSRPKIQKPKSQPPKGKRGRKVE